MTLYGKSFKDAAKDAVLSTAANTLGQEVSREIGAEYAREGSNLNYLTHKIVHALTGGATGALKGAVNGDAEGGSIAGATGAVIGEIIGDAQTNAIQGRVKARVEALEAQGVEVTPEDAQNILLNEFNGTLQAGKLTAALVALATGKDPSIAADAAETAMENNSRSKIFSKLLKELSKPIKKFLSKKRTQKPKDKKNEGQKKKPIKKTESGISVSKHSVSRKVERGVKSKDELDALKNPLKIREVKIDSAGRASQKYIGEKATVSVNPQTNKIIQTNPTGRKLAEKLLRDKK